uniref:C3H1-type domain-containing protein n=1 Tax=Culex tarsalis TaxID=7177 RepID=A0A1Q3EZ80_CULTA
MSEHEDLEDGEIEDDDEDEVPVAASAAAAPEQPASAGSAPADTGGPVDDPRDAERDRAREIQEKVQSVKKMIDAKARLIDEVAPPSSKSSKRAKSGPVVDDWATKVENALANALIKDGVEPPMPSISRRSEERDSEVPSKRRKRDRQKKKPPQPEKSTNEEMEEIDLEYEMMNVRGGSPRPQQRGNNTEGGSNRQQHERSDSEDSYSSDESRGGRRDRRDRERERDREYNRRKRKNRQRNRARDNRKRKRDDSDDEKHHNRNSGPRKMELCKFYLMDCCAKREKCLYMHSDFPCKYYYLGLKCKEQDACLFSHGDPLTDELRVILLKHLETAPQEILGDFPRINRESAIKMVNATHQKLTNKAGKASGGGGEGAAAADGEKIPSLLDMMVHGGAGSKNRRSRWCDKNPGNGSNSGEDFLSLKYLNGVISQEQIANLEDMGIHNLDQISQLTVAQLNELGLSISQIHELQLNALNMKKLRENIAKQEDSEGGVDPASSSKDMDMRITPSHSDLQKSIGSDVGPLGGGQDVDMRFLPMVNTAGPTEATGNDSNSNSNSREEIDQLLPLSSLIKTPTVDYSQYLKDSNLNDDDDMDHGTRAFDDDDDDDEENNLKINIEEDPPEDSAKDRTGLGSFEWEDEEERRPLQPQPAVFDTKLVTQSMSTQKIDYTKSFGMYKPADEESEKPPTDSCILDRYSDDSDSSKKKSDIFSARKSMYNLDPPGASSPSTLGWTPTSGTTTTTAAPSSSTTEKSSSSSKPPLRPSIYDDPCGSDNNSDDEQSAAKSSAPYADRDKDMRLNFLGLGETAKLGDDSLGASSSDVDLRLPFKPIMTNYIPATEIDGSVTSHAPIAYKVHEVDIPKPNYKDIRRNTPRPERTKDPRLRRIFGMYNEDDNNGGENKATGDGLLQGMRSPRSSTSMASGVAAAGPIAPRVDPRTKRSQENKSQQLQQQQQQDGGSSSNVTKSNQLDVQTILLRSSWYTDLSSKHKIMVNQQLAILSTEMKKYHNSDKSTDKLAEFMQQLATNQMLQFILTNLNVYVDDSVTFCEVPMVSSPPLPMMNVPPPNLMPPMNMLPPVNIPPPIATQPPSLFDLPRFNCPPEVRPGLLGVAPNMPFEQFLAMGQVNKGNNNPQPPPLLDDWGECWDDDPNLNRGGGGGGGGGGFVPNFERNTNNNNNFNNGPRGNPMRNHNNRSGSNFRNNDRWNNSGGNGPNRRNNNHHRRMDKKK